MQKKSNSWFYSISRVGLPLKKIKGFEAWFYTGGTVVFGHTPSAKKGKR